MYPVKDWNLESLNSEISMKQYPFFFSFVSILKIFYWYKNSSVWEWKTGRNQTYRFNHTMKSEESTLFSKKD